MSVVGEAAELGTVQLKTLLFVGLSLSIGWGIRGNFGHQWGAALPGALAAMAAVIISGREDWMRRIAYFGAFGAIGWSFGGNMAYMVVIAYTHSGHSPSVLYGFFCLGIIGFLWAAVGGAGTAMPAMLSRERLAQFCIPLVSMFFLWWVYELLTGYFIDRNPRFADNSPLDWHDTNWNAAILAIVAVFAHAAVRRRIDWAEKLILWMAVGWWIGFLTITVGIHFLMAPNKGEDWSGSVGMTAALFIYLYRNGCKGAVMAGLITGVLGGLAFPLGVLFKLLEMYITHDYPTNWHSILEQSYGFMNGLAQAAGILLLVKTSPAASDEPAVSRAYNAFMVAFLMLLLTYLNIWKEVNDWITAKAVAPQLYFLTTSAWFDLFYLLLAGTFLLLLREHLRRPLPFIPVMSLGKAQMLYLALLWWMVIANFMKALVAFGPQRLVTEGTIFVNGLLCTLMALLWARRSQMPSVSVSPVYWPTLRKTILRGSVALLLCPFLCWGVVRAIYGDRFAGEAGHHYRFGPKAVPAKE